MSGAFRRVSPNSLVRPKGSTWNAVTGAVQAFQKTTELHGQEGQRRTFIDSGMILARNNAGVALPRYSIVMLEACPRPVTSLDDWKSSEVFNVKKPEGNDLIIAVTQAYAAIGDSVPAIINGITPVQVDVQSEVHPYAKAVVNDIGKLVSTWDPIGSEIVWIDSGSGTKWAKVRLGGFNRETSLIGKTINTISDGGSGDVRVWQNGSDTLTSVEAHLDWMHGGQDVSASKQVLITYFIGDKKWRIVGAECE